MIQFLGSITTTAVPANGTIKERGLAFNITDGILYTSTNGTDVVKLSSDRGVEYNAGTTYETGDIVSYLGDIYIVGAVPPAAGVLPSDPTFSDVDSLSPEVGGIAFQDAFNPGYTLGDMIVSGNAAYFCNTTYAPTVDFATDKANFTAIGTPEKGGVAWAGTIDYVIGDTVSENSILYIANVGHTSLAGNVADGSPSQTAQTNWDKAVQDEHGGRAYDLNLGYETGDLVYYVIGAQRALHVKITDSTTDGPGTTPTGTTSDTAWQMFAPERGGVLFSLTKAYIDGDIVSDATDEVYIHIGGETTGDEPSTSPGSWKVLGSASSNAGTGGQDAAIGLTFNGGNNHIPAPADNNNGSTEEYPDTGGESVGAQWTVFGLTAPYIMLTGSISGTTVNNGDTFQWVSGVSGTAGAGTEGWFHQAAPTISAERGGLAWQSSEAYAVGDLVTDGLVVYTATSTSINEQPLLNFNGIGTDAWKTTIDSEIGGVAFIDATDYTVGDIVVDGVAYFCNNSHTSDIGGLVGVDSPSNGGTSWTAIGVDERGGIAHQVAPFVYAIGDVVVGTDGKLFRNLTGTNGGLPASNVEASTDWSNDIITDPGLY